MSEVITSDNGAYMGLGDMAGTIIGLAYSQDDISSAKSALSNWSELIPLLKNEGQSELQDAATLLDPADKVLQALAKMSQSGYVPDYVGIMNRATQAGALQFDTQIREAKRQQSRYGLGLDADVEVKLRVGEMAAVAGAYALASEKAREFMWSESFKFLSEGASVIEGARVKRVDLGANLIAGSIDDYIELGNAYREIATVNVGESAELAAFVGELLPMWFSQQWIQNSMTAFGGIL